MVVDGKLLYHGQEYILSASSRDPKLSWSGDVGGTVVLHFPRGMREQWSEFHIVPNHETLALLMLNWCILREAILEVQLAFSRNAIARSSCTATGAQDQSQVSSN